MKEKEIKECIDFWVKELGLQNYDINFGIKKTNRKKQGNYEEVAKNDTNPEYNAAFLTFQADKLDEVDDKVILHELIHCITSELKGYIKQNKKPDFEWVSYFEEKTTSVLTNIIYNIMAMKKPVKKAGKKCPSCGKMC